MKLMDLLLEDRAHKRYAYANLVGIRRLGQNRTCRDCLWPTHFPRSGPSVVVWEKGAALIPDFVNDPPLLIVTDRVKRAFEQAGLKGYVAWPVAVQEPKRVPKRPRVPQVPSPYPGPPLWEIYIERLVRVIPEGSTLEFLGRCPRCGRKKYSTLGQASRLRFLVDRRSWRGEDFMLLDIVNAVLVSERVADVVDAHQFTNVTLVEQGELVDPGPPAAGEKRTIEWSEYFPELYGPAESESDEAEPGSREELKSMSPEFERLAEDSATSCPVTMADLLEYLRMEADVETLSAGDLTFIRTARVEDRAYWIWRFEEDDGTESFATVSRDPDETICFGCGWNDENLTAEQYLYGEYHEYF